MDGPHIFVSIKPKPGHEHEAGRLLRKLMDFCEETKAGFFLTGPHRIPGHDDTVLTIYFHSDEEKDDFLHMDEYHQFRIDLVEHCEAKDISVLK